MTDPDPPPSSTILPYASPDAHDGRRLLLGVFIVLVATGLGFVGAASLVFGIMGVFFTFFGDSRNDLAGNIITFSMLIITGGAVLCACRLLCKSAREIISGKSS